MAEFDGRTGPAPVVITSFDDLPAYCLVGEVASFFRVTPLTIKKWIKAGKFPGATQPTTTYWTIPKEDVAKQMESLYGQKPVPRGNRSGSFQKKEIQ